MSDKSPKVKILYVPIYEGDTGILDRLPPAAAGQWARQLLLRQVQMDEQMFKGFGEVTESGSVIRDEVRRVIHEEMEPVLSRMDDSMDKLIEEKLTALEQTLLQAIQKNVQEAMEKEHGVAEGMPSPDSDETKENLPDWRRITESGDWG